MLSIHGVGGYWSRYIVMCVMCVCVKCKILRSVSKGMSKVSLDDEMPMLPKVVGTVLPPLPYFLPYPAAVS